MSVAVELITLARETHLACRNVCAYKKVVKAVGQKLLALTPLLEALQQRESSAWEAVGMDLKTDLLELTRTVQEVKAMNRIYYMLSRHRPSTKTWRLYLPAFTLILEL